VMMATRERGIVDLRKQSSLAATRPRERGDIGEGEEPSVRDADPDRTKRIIAIAA
jgi:hypothetical protein